MVEKQSKAILRLGNHWVAKYMHIYLCVIYVYILCSFFVLFLFFQQLLNYTKRYINGCFALSMPCSCPPALVSVKVSHEHILSKQLHGVSSRIM